MSCSCGFALCSILILSRLNFFVMIWLAVNTIAVNTSIFKFFFSLNGAYCSCMKSTACYLELNAI